ncbi:LacI family DNA-binding transcriptional regulator [Coraliomargarita sp. W4R53]
MARPKQTVSILSIAKEFKVSKSTISKALSNSSEISESLRARVRDRADELGFTPKRPRQTSYNICVVIDLGEDDTFQLDGFRRAVVEGVYSFCNENQLEISLLGHNSIKLNTMDLTQVLYRRNADAAVLIGAKEGQAYFKNLTNNRFPFACVYDGPREQTITLDDYTVGELALNHLTDLGHEHIAIARNLPGRHSFASRYDGFMQAAQAKGLNTNTLTTLSPNEAEASYEWGREILNQWIADKKPWSAIFFFAKNTALGLLSEAAHQGIHIPSQLSVLTCDNLISCAQAAPTLSVVDIPNQAAGYQSAKYAWELLLSEKIVELPAPLAVEQVIHRNSTATFKKKA